MENTKPKFRLENITKLPENASEIIKEILAEIGLKKKLQPALAGAGNLNYSCDPHCSCNTECNCDSECNYCKCVSDCKCESYCMTHNDTCFRDDPPTPSCGCDWYACGCDNN